MICVAPASRRLSRAHLALASSNALPCAFLIAPAESQSVRTLDGFQCRTCGKWHDGLPLDYGYSAPHYWFESLRNKPDSFLNADLCVIEQRDYFVRGLIEIPVIGSKEAFRWGVWVSLSHSNFDRMVELCDNPQLLEEPPYFGWLSNSIDEYPETLNLKANVRSRDLRHRPYITLEQTDHPLSVEQQQGIGIQRVREIVERALHP